MVQGLSPGAIPDEEPEPVKNEEWRENLNIRMICRDCQEDPPSLVEDHATGDLVCGNCGLVLRERNIDLSSEWRNFGNDESGNDDPSRVGDGPNDLLNGDQLSTGIAFGDGGMRTKELHRAQNRSTLDKSNKQLLVAYKQIGAFADAWELPMAVSDSAKHIYKDAVESPAFKGKSSDSIVAGSIFIACRRNGVGRSFREVTDITNVSKKEIGKTFKALEAMIQKKTKADAKTRYGAGGQVLGTDQSRSDNMAKPADLCARFCSRLGMDQKVTNVSVALAERVQASGVLAGRSPLSTASACIFMAGHLLGQSKSAKDIQEIARVSDSTIRQAYKLMYGVKETLITQEMLDRGADPAKLPKPA